MAGCSAEDFDGDLLSNEREAELKLDPRLADTDGDSVEDGYEYQAALDLNHYPATTPLPYPGKRPYPNPLDPSDGTPAGSDYDGDGLKLREEFLLWVLTRKTGAAGTGARPLPGLVYSDGLQFSVYPKPSVRPPARSFAGRWMARRATVSSRMTSAMPTPTDSATGTRCAAA